MENVLSSALFACISRRKPLPLIQLLDDVSIDQLLLIDNKLFDLIYWLGSLPESI